MATSTQLPLCVYCGTARPADQSRCPQCGRPWIDVHVGTRREAREPVMVGAAVGSDAARAKTPPPDESEATGEIPSVAPPPPSNEPQNDESRSFVWLIPALVGAAALTVLALVAFGILDDQVETVAIATPPSTTPTTVAATTTQPPAPTTTAAPTTTTTTTTIPEPASLASVGEAISAPALKLRAGGIGPIDIGTPAEEAVGRLVASLGTPDEVGVAGEELGLCPDEEGRFARWAGFTAVVSGRFDGGTFAGYRFDEQTIPTFHLDLATPSGIRLGDSVSTLNQTYSAYQIDYVTSNGADVFRLSDADGLLLWGPVSSPEDTGRIEGIYSPDACAP